MGKCRQRMSQALVSPPDHGDRGNIRSIDPVELMMGRPSDARRRIFMALKRNSCFSCSKCCKEMTGISIFHDDPHLNDILMELRRRSVSKNSLIPYDRGYLLSFPSGESCYFLDEQTNRCSIYSIRPTVCRTYPFVTEDSQLPGNGPKYYTWVSAQCLSISSLICQGIRAIRDREIIISVADARNDPKSFVDDVELPFFMSVLDQIPRERDLLLAPFLGDAFTWVVRNMREGLLPQAISAPRPPFLTSEGSIIFPIR